MSACKEAIMKVRKMACLPAALEAILDAAVRADEQHHGEPVALAIPEDCPHIIVFDDADMEDEHFSGSGAKPAALRRFEQVSQSWNAHLFVRVARNSRDDRYPSATVADPAEVERLRKDLVRWKGVAETLEVDALKLSDDGIDFMTRAKRAEGEVERLRKDVTRKTHCYQVERAKGTELRAQLAERDALLQYTDDQLTNLQPHIEQACYPGKAEFIDNYVDPVIDRIRAISASAEPSAPPEQSEWRPLTAPGQVQEGDRLSFRVGSSFICARARQIIAPGTDKEEIVYNRKKNHYFLTSMAVDGTSSHKNVMVARVTA